MPNESDKKSKGKDLPNYGEKVPRGFYRRDPNKDVHPRDMRHPSTATNRDDTITYLRHTDVSAGEDPMRNWSMNPREWEAVGKNPGSTAGYYYTNNDNYTLEKKDGKNGK